MSTAPVSRSLSNDGLEAERGSHQARSGQATEARSETRAPQTQLLVLSRNPELVDAVRNAARTVARVFHARDLDDAARSLSHVDPGVLLIDGTTTDDVVTLIVQGMRRFPEGVVVVVGSREASGELMQLAAAGRIFRFLLMPLSYGPVRLALAAAVTHHTELRAANRTIASLPEQTAFTARKYALAYVALAAALLAVIGVLWRVSGSLALQWPAPPLANRAVTSNPVSTDALANPTPVNPIPAQLALAAKALAEGRYAEPTGASALDLYRGVLQSDPDNATARGGVRAITDQFLQRAEEALLAESLEDAERILQQVHSIDADHPRLGFLDSRVSRERELRNLTARRDVANRVRQLVGEARSDMSAGDLIGTAAGGALGALLAARRLDPADTAVVQTIRELNAALADAVRMAVTAGDTARASAFANAARKLGTGEQLLAAIDRSLQEPKRNPAPPSATPSAPSPPPSAPAPQRVEEPRVAKAEPVPVTAADAVLQAADLPRVRQVTPSYPKEAQRAGIEGYVDLEFTISTEGIPRNLLVVASTPRRVFESAAINCVRQWRFEPIQQNGLPATPRAVLRLRFQLQ